MNLGAPEMLIVFAVVMLLFGSAKVPALARSLGEARREFVRGTSAPREDHGSRDGASSAPSEGATAG